MLMHASYQGIALGLLLDLILQHISRLFYLLLICRDAKFLGLYSLILSNT